MIRALAAILLLSLRASSSAAELRRETLQAWSEYLTAAEARLKPAPDTGRPFLWSDENPIRARQVVQGEILAAPGNGTSPYAVPHGLIHDWIGEVFIPGATLSDLLAVTRSYDRYQQFYQPTVVASKLISRENGLERYSMRWVHKVLFVTAAVDGEYETHEYALNETQGYGSSQSTRLVEVRDYGDPGEHQLPPDRGNGFLWRIYSASRWQQRDGGVYLEVEALGLTRDVPAWLRWLVNPIISRWPRDSRVATLRMTRDAVKMQMAAGRR